VLGAAVNFRLLWLALAVAAVGLLPAGARAAVALAVGVTDNPSDGMADGYSYNYKSESEARHDALEQCRAFKTASKAARNCHLIGSLKKGCLAIAFDPDKDSSGMGWALAEKREDAESKAVENCREAAPRGRQKYCKIDTLKCDGDASPKKQ
jgi:hypothetical protein